MHAFVCEGERERKSRKRERKREEEMDWFAVCLLTLVHAVMRVYFSLLHLFHEPRKSLSDFVVGTLGMNLKKRNFLKSA